MMLLSVVDLPTPFHSACGLAASQIDRLHGRIGQHLVHRSLGEHLALVQHGYDVRRLPNSESQMPLCPLSDSIMLSQTVRLPNTLGT